MDQNALVDLLSAARSLVGVIGTILPAIPGTPLVFAGMLLAAWTGDFQSISLATVVVLAVLTVVALSIDFIAGLLGAKRVGASRLAIVGAAIGTFIGLFFGIPGLSIGPFAGALIGEWLRSRDFRKASKVGAATWIGVVVGAVVKLVLKFAMLGVFLLALSLP